MMRSLGGAGLAQSMRTEPSKPKWRSASTIWTATGARPTAGVRAIPSDVLPDHRRSPGGVVHSNDMFCTALSDGLFAVGGSSG